MRIVTVSLEQHPPSLKEQNIHDEIRQAALQILSQISMDPLEKKLEEVSLSPKIFGILTKVIIHDNNNRAEQAV